MNRQPDAGAGDLGRSLDAVIELLEAEVARLQSELETLRLTRHPERDALIRDRVRRIDQRQDRLEALRRLVTTAEALLSEEASKAPDSSLR